MLTDEFITTITANRKKASLWPWVAVLCFFVLPFTAGISPFLFLLWPILSIPLVLFIRDKDHKRKAVSIEYPEHLRTDPVFMQFCEAFRVMTGSRKIWRVISSTDVKDRKRNAGASHNIVRWRARVFLGLPRYVDSNLRVPVIVGSKKLFFFPDAILIVEGNTYRKVQYQEMRMLSGTTRFIESGFYPKDAPVVDHTWQFVNKSGGADKRMKNNRRFPVLCYDTLNIICQGVINDEFYVSLEEAADGFSRAFKSLRDSRIVGERAGVNGSTSRIVDTAFDPMR